MKKFIFSLSALAALFLAGSCQRENLEPVQQGGTVTYTVQVPQDIATKADGDDVFTLHYEVYRKDANGELTTLFYEGTQNFNTNGTADVPLEFVKDQKFKVLFWAQNDDQQAYNIENLRSVSLNTLVANDTTAEVFAGSDDVDNCESAQGGNVVLVRPVAQLNIATTAAGLQLGTTATVTPKQSMVIVDGLYDTYNVATGTAGTKASRTYARPTDGTPNVPGTDFKNGYKLMATNYLGFIPQAGDNVEVKFTIYTEKDGNIEHTVSNVPVKANYQTNILGNLISATADYQVTLEDWADAGKSMEVLTDGLVKNINGDYEVSSVNGLAYAINNLFVDANGVANAKTFYVKPGIYDMAQQAINDITVTSGTLKVYDTEAVVTRSATTGSVIITGLKKALIKEVREDATVFFSGIIVKDFKGADGAAALVQNNVGKVVLADCQILDENDAPDQDTKLVGGNDPVEVEKGEEEAGDLIYTAKQLAAAFEDESVKSIALGADITLENTLVFPEGRTATLDLRGWELTVNEPASNYAINNHGTLTIKDSYATGEVNARGIYNGYVAEGDQISSAKLIVESGSFNAMGTNGGAAVFNYGQLEINGGKFTSVASYSVSTQAGGKVTVNGGEILGGMYNSGCEVIIINGKIEGNRSGCHTVYNYNANVTIKGGTFHNNNSGNSTIMAAGTTTIKYKGGTYSIKDGRVEGNGNTWTSCLIDSQNTATSEITAGTFNGGFRVQAGTSMTITGGSFNDCSGSNYNIYGSVSITGGTYTDASAKAFATKYAHKDYKLVDEEVVPKEYTVQIGAEKYESIQEAVNDAQDGSTITFIADVEQEDGVLITDKNLTIDLNDKTFTVSKGANTNNRNFKVNGSSVVTIKNGTMVADGELTSGAYGTVRTDDSANVTLNKVESYSYRGYGLNIKANTGSTITINDSEIYAQYSGGVEAAGGTIVLNNVKITQEGVYSSGAWCSVAIGVNGGGKVTVNSGEYSAAAIATDSNAAQGTWVAYVMSSGGTLDIKGGTFNGTVAETAAAANACGLICADTKAVVNIYDGTFNSNGAILDMRNNTGGSPNPVATLYGGTFSADPTVSGLYGSNLISVVEGYEVYEEDGLWKVGEEGIRSWTEFTQALAAGETEFKLQADLLTDTNYTLSKDITLDLNGKTLEISPASGTLNIGDTKNSSKPNVTIKNGNLNCMVYALSGNVTITDVIFGGTIAYVQASQGVISTKYANLLMDNCKMTNVMKSGATKPRSLCTEGRSSGYLILRNCNFKNSNLDRPYINPLNGTATLELTNCALYSMASNIDLGASYSWTNMNLTGCSGGFTFTISRASTSLTDEEMAVYKAIKKNNSGSMRFIFSDGEKNNL